MTTVCCFLVRCSNQSWFRDKLAQLKSAKSMALFLIIENASLAAYADMCVACMMYTTVPATEASSDGRVV